MHWSDGYIGRPYAAQGGDCADLAAAVAREVLGIECALPTAHATSYREQARQVMACRDDLAERVAAPIDGQPILLHGRGRTCHIGVACLIGGETWVLHADQAAGFVVRERLRQLTQVRYQLEGYYRWK